MRISIIQNSASPEKEKNIKKVFRLMESSLESRPDILVLTEGFFFRGDRKALREYAEDTSTGPTVHKLKQFSKKNRVNLIAGSIFEPAGKDKYYNTSIIINKSGKIIAKYRKIHLFKVKLKDKKNIDETLFIAPGKKPVIFKINNIKCSVLICYDIRFPEVFRVLTEAGCRIIFIVSNFTRETGKAHWLTLLRARAIENQLFIAAANQTGKDLHTGVESYGHSVIYDPWGEELKRAGYKEGIISADLDFRVLKDVRKKLPVLNHINKSAYKI
jgi:predicted amidohydrolase